MGILKKVLCFPLVLSLGIISNIFKFVFITVGSLLNIVSLVYFIIGIIGLVNQDYMRVCLPCFTFSYLVCPYGLPVIGAVIIAQIDIFRDWVRGY